MERVKIKTCQHAPHLPALLEVTCREAALAMIDFCCCCCCFKRYELSL